MVVDQKAACFGAGMTQHVELGGGRCYPTRITMAGLLQELRGSCSNCVVTH